MLFNLEEYEIVIFPDESGDDKYFVATTLEMPSISGCSDTPENALKELKTAFELTREVYKEDNEDMPVPANSK